MVPLVPVATSGTSNGCCPAHSVTASSVGEVPRLEVAVAQVTLDLLQAAAGELRHPAPDEEPRGDDVGRRYAPAAWEVLGYGRTLAADERVRGKAALVAPLYALAARRAVGSSSRGTGPVRRGLEGSPPSRPARKPARFAARKR